MPSSIEPAAAFAALLKASNTELHEAYWFDLFEIDKKSSNKFTMISFTGLNEQEYVELLTKSGLALSVGPEQKLKMSNVETWNNFFINNNIDNAKVEPKKILGIGRSYYLRIGPQKHTPYKDAKEQHAAQPKCPRTPGLKRLKDDLKQAVQNNTIEMSRDCNNSINAPPLEQLDTSVAILDEVVEMDIDDIPADLHNNKVNIASFIHDMKSLTDAQLQHVMYRMMKEQHTRSPEKQRRSVFVMSHHHGEVGGIVVPQHRDDTAFYSYNKKHPYVEQFAEMVGNGDPSVGAARVFDVLASHHSRALLQVGATRGLSMASQFDENDIGALATDCNLKTWQLKRIFKHFKKVTGCKLNAVPINKALKDLSKDIVQPQTGTYEHEYTDDNDNLKKETVEWEYQSICEVYKHIIVAIMAENSVNPEDVEKLFLILGGDHGIGAFRMPFRTVLLLKDGRHLKKDIGIATIICKKDTGEVILNTIMDVLTADLKLINNSSVVIGTDEVGALTCKLVTKGTQTATPRTNTIQSTTLYITGDIKWFCMLLGMEDMAPHYCVYCHHRAQDWKKERNHDKASDRTIESIIETVEKYNLTSKTKSNPKYRGVKSMPFWDFIPVDNYALSLLHIWMGIFNDIDRWFMEQVHLLMGCSERERDLRKELPLLIAKKNELLASFKAFEESEQGKLYKRLSGKEKRRTKLTNDEIKDLSDLKQLRNQIVEKKDATKTAVQDAKSELSNFAKALKRNGKSYYHAIQNHWKERGKSKGAYHGGAWNGKDARDAMKEPEHYYATMYNILTEHKADTTTTRQIRVLLNNTCKLLHRWHEVFHTLRSEKREEGWEVALSLQTRHAIKLHRKFGLSITPKVHIIEDHAVRQAEKMDISFFYLIEEFVEQNHQTGHKEEERLKRIKNADKRAKAKAERIWIELNPDVQKCIQLVAKNDSRNPYNTSKKRKLEEISPSPFRCSELLCGSPSWDDCYSCGSCDDDDKFFDRLISDDPDYSPRAPFQPEDK